MKALAVSTTVEIRRDRLIALIAAVAVLATGITWAFSTYAVNVRDATAQNGSSGRASMSPAVGTHTALDAGSPRSLIASMTPAGIQAGALGGYALPTNTSNLTLYEVLASLDPATRRYTKMIMGLTVDQLRAGAAGSP
jgi:hypothetical protein